MILEEYDHLIIEQSAIPSVGLKRHVLADFYLPKSVSHPHELNLLIINDGQDLDEMKFADMLNSFFTTGQLLPLLCIGLHADKHRRQEYGVASQTDYAGRGEKSAAYQQFIMEDLLSFTHQQFGLASFREMAICGFSLGGLSAIDTAWNHGDKFTRAGVFSGSLWWRSHELNADYNDDLHRIMHAQVRSSASAPDLKYYFTTGSLDETADRNQNGIIDSIDDTTDLIMELKKKGAKDDDIVYINYADGKHDVATWGRAMPDFLKWGWGRGRK